MIQISVIFGYKPELLSRYRRSASGSEAYGSESDFIGYHPHLHILVPGGCFHENGVFTVPPAIDTKALEQLFRNKVLKMLLAKGKITQDMIKLLDKWRDTGFNVYCGPPLIPDSYRASRCRDEALGEGQSVNDYVIDPDTPVEAYF
ncbi:hypothetical protein DRQ05_01370 [bacterium]|nr:MAG: hypothetical protein DRQ05_01370 [bacterium]